MARSGWRTLIARAPVPVRWFVVDASVITTIG
jgi:hypothetical protein